MHYARSFRENQIMHHEPGDSDWKRNKKLAIGFLFALHSYMALSCIILEIKRIIGRKSHFFHTLLHSTSLFGGFRRSIVWCGKNRMAWLSKIEKNVDDMFSRFDKIPARDRRTSCDSIVRAVHTIPSCGKNYPSREIYACGRGRRHRCLIPVQTLPLWHLWLWRGLTRDVHIRATIVGNLLLLFCVRSLRTIC